MFRRKTNKIKEQYIMIDEELLFTVSKMRREIKDYLILKLETK